MIRDSTIRIAADEATGNGRRRRPHYDCIHRQQREEAQRVFFPSTRKKIGDGHRGFIGGPSPGEDWEGGWVRVVVGKRFPPPFVSTSSRSIS